MDPVRGGDRDDQAPFDAGAAYHDAPPPEVLEDLAALRDADRFRFANQLTGWIEVEDDKIVGLRPGRRRG